MRTRYGRSIRVTGDHSVFTEGPDGEPVPVPVEELEPGQRIAIARRIEVPERDRREVSMLDVWHRAEGDSWDLTVEADGLGELAWEHRRSCSACSCPAVATTARTGATGRGRS